MILFSVTAFIPAQAQLWPGAALPEDTERGFESTFDTDVDVRTALAREVGRIIQAVLGFVGAVMLVVIVYAGYLWLTAGGKEDQVTKAKAYIRNAIIGLIIVLTSFLVVNFVIDRLETAFNPPRQAVRRVS